MESENNILERVGITLSGKFSSAYYPIGFYFQELLTCISLFKLPKTLYLIIIFFRTNARNSEKTFGDGLPSIYEENSGKI